MQRLTRIVAIVSVLGAVVSVLATRPRGVIAEVTNAVTNTANGTPVNSYLTQDPNPNSGLRGWHINRPSGEALPHGISFDMDGTPIWDMGIDFEFPDLILAYSHTTKSDQLRMRADTGQTELGPVVGHPVTTNQLNITAGTPEAPLDGVGVGVNGNRNGLYIYQTNATTKRAKVNFNEVFQMGTDSGMNNTRDFWVFNNGTGRFPVMVAANDAVTLGYGATVGGNFRHTGASVGFYGAPGTAKPTITGKRSTGEAWANLLTKLVAMGLVNDGTTP